jgi:hypothetical protein
MDFATDDNSYRSAQVASEFTILLQVQLANEAEIQWIERAQLEQARREVELSTAGLAGGGSPIQRGKWLNADWIVSGDFSLDDKSQRALSLEVIDLRHADVLANKTIAFTGAAAEQFQISSNQLNQAASTLHELLSEAAARQKLLSQRALVLPLFLADVTRFGSGLGFSAEKAVLERTFLEALERAAATNREIEMVHFPKAYRSTEESEMVLNGLVEADRNAWQHSADLYVWGTYATASRVTPGKPRHEVLEIVLQLWDGSSAPVVVKEELSQGATPAQLEAALERLASQTISHAHRRAAPKEGSSVHQEIAQSLVKSYEQMTVDPSWRASLGLNEPVKFLQAVHLLETACFFDPDNAKARMFYVSCRWGWWMDFGFTVKNQFWSKCRRSQAWGKYVERFGLKDQEGLPFPYHGQGGIAKAYLRSVEDVLEMFPQWHSAEEAAHDTEDRRRGVHTVLKEAEFHGFPKEMPYEAVMKWRTELEAERWKRLTRTAESIKESPPLREKLPSPLFSVVSASLLEKKENQSPAARLGILEKIWPECAKYAQTYGKQWLLGAGELGEERENRLADLCTQAGSPQRSGQLLAMLSPPGPDSTTLAISNSTAHKTPANDPARVVQAPAWLKEGHQGLSMLRLFELFPPQVLPLEVKPVLQEVQFPSQCQVRSILKMDFLGTNLLVLAMDERTRASSDAAAEIHSERLDERNHLWVLGNSNTSPVLYEPQTFGDSINSFLLKDQELWIAGRTTGFLNLGTGTFRSFGLAEGFDLQTCQALAFAGGRYFAAGDGFRFLALHPPSNQWTNLPLPPARLAAGTGSPTLLAANKGWLCYVAGTALVLDLKHGTWTTAANSGGVRCIAADESGFWFGSYDGLMSMSRAAGFQPTGTPRWS